MPPEAPRPKMTLKPTDTSRLKTKISTPLPKEPPPAPEKPAAPSPAPEAAAQQTTMLTDPLTLRDTDASRLKRVKLDSQEAVSASAISPAVGLGRDKRDTTDTVHLKVIREKRKEVPGVGLVSQTVRLRPATKSPEAAGDLPDAASVSVAPTPRPSPMAPAPAKAAPPAAPATMKPLVPKAPPVATPAAAPAVSAEPTEEETGDSKIRTTTVKVRPSAGLKPLPAPGSAMSAPATPAPALPKTPPPAEAAAMATPELAEPTEEETGDSTIRTTTVKLRPSAGLKPLPAPGGSAFAAAATMAVPPPTPTSAPAAKPGTGHTIKIKSMMPTTAATAPATQQPKPAATVALPAAPELPTTGGTVKITAEAPAGGQAKKTLKLKIPVSSGEAGIAFETAGDTASDAAAREAAAGTDMLSFAFSALTVVALVTLVVLLALQVKPYVL